MPSNKHYNPSGTTFVGELMRGTPPDDPYERMRYETAQRDARYAQKLKDNPQFQDQVDAQSKKTGTIYGNKIVSGTVDQDQMMTDVASNVYNNYSNFFGGGDSDAIATADRLKAAADGPMGVNSFARKSTQPITPFKLTNPRTLQKNLASRNKYANLALTGIMAADAADNAFGREGVLRGLLTQQDSPGTPQSYMARTGIQTYR